MENIIIAGREIGPGHPPYIIAEIGANHNGDMELCRRLIDAAAKCGVDAVKFQSWSKHSLVSAAEYARNTRYNKDSASPDLAEAVERYQLTPEAHHQIASYCRETGVVFFSSCFSPGEVDLLAELGAPAYKVASMDVNNPPLLDYVGHQGKPVILSTGLATLGEIETALRILRQAGAPVLLLHCVSLYPSPPEVVALNNIRTLQMAFDVPVGYSDHSLGIGIAAASVALGACAIERHFTLNKSMDGWDHAISADPEEMFSLVRECRDVFVALGSAVRTVTPAQMDKRKAFRRRLVIRRPIRKGGRIQADDVDFKRPGTGIHPDELPYVLNRPVNRDIAAEEELDWQDLT